MGLNSGKHESMLNVFRVNRFTPLYFPDTMDTFNRQMLRIIQVISQARLLMEGVYKSIIHDQTSVTLTFNNEEQSPIPPCFQTLKPFTNKRRRKSSELENESEEL